MEDTDWRSLVDVGKGKDVGTARRRTGDDKGLTALPRRRRATGGIRRGDMRRTVDDD